MCAYMSELPLEECRECDGTGKQWDHRAIGNLLRKEREAIKISSRQLADAMEIGYAFLSDLERGRRNWTEEKITRFREALKKITKTKP